MPSYHKSHLSLFFFLNYLHFVACCYSTSPLSPLTTMIGREVADSGQGFNTAISRPSCLALFKWPWGVWSAMSLSR